MVQETMPSYSRNGWWDRKVGREVDRDDLRLGERIGNVIAIFFIFLVVYIFLYIQDHSYGFFTTGFGPLTKLLFYGSILYGIVPSVVRAASGKRNLGRLFDILGSILFIIVAIYLLVNFPFDVARLIDAFPSSLQSSFQWVNDDLLRLLIELGIIVSIVSVVYNLVLYMAVRRELRARRTI